MKIQVLLVTIAMLYCSCKNGTVNGMAILNTDQVTTASHQPIAELMKPKVLIETRILTAAKPVYDKAVIPNSKVNNASKKSTAEPVNARPLIEPRILTAKKPVDDKKTTPDFAVDYSSDQSETALEVRSDVSSVNLLEALENPSTDLAQIQKNLQFCASARCSRIYCENNLPAIPTQRICCPRCVTNPKCDASECPTLKCRTYIIPADFSTDECCDRCAPTSANDADQTKISKHLRRFRNGTPKYGKSSESHHSSSSSSSSSEKDPLRYIGCLVPPFENQPKHCESVFMQLIGEITVRLHDEEYDGFDDMSDSGGMFMDK
ncbi:unnamed protein product [Rotaria socialis]|uniref:Uncharacterized protein n=1 Tax=Rotaria socialis TaxID=392032 RepID=A0A821LEY2_9BILA|nr:unnamed protein product [Rotaria socialis]CAF4749331.1 unnamed protein product [Rotaria socialis]